MTDRAGESRIGGPRRQRRGAGGAPPLTELVSLPRLEAEKLAEMRDVTGCLSLGSSREAT